MALAGHRIWERAGEPRGLPRAEGWAQQLSAAWSSCSAATWWASAAAPTAARCFLEERDPAAPHDVCLGVLLGVLEMLNLTEIFWLRTMSSGLSANTGSYMLAAENGA